MYPGSESPFTSSHEPPTAFLFPVDNDDEVYDDNNDDDDDIHEDNQDVNHDDNDIRDDDADDDNVPYLFTDTAHSLIILITCLKVHVPCMRPIYPTVTQNR